MRAVGYVPPGRVRHESTDGDQDGQVSWSAVVDPSAGSWGAPETGGVSAGPMPTEPAARIVRYCQDNGHNLVALLGVEGGSDALDLQLGISSPTSDADPDEAEMFGYLIAALTPPAGHPALALIHDASHLADDVETLILRLMQIRRTGSDTQCTDPEMPDPLQSGLSMLPLTKDHATDASDPDQSVARPPAGDVPKVIALASNGRVLGRTPYGYRSDDSGTLVPVPHEAQVVRNVFDWYAGTHDSEPMGMRTIVQRLDDKAARTRSGKRWSTAAISLMLKNKVYVGTYERYGFLVAGNHAPIVERSTFNLAQQKMAERSNSAKLAEADAAFLLGGLVRCADCGHAISGLSRKRSWRRKDDSVAMKVYRYYEFADCARRRKPRRSGQESDAVANENQSTQCPSWRAETLEALVKERVTNLTAQELDAVVPKDEYADLPERFKESRRRFHLAVQRVASGKGDIELLLPDIEAMDELRTQLATRRDAKSGSAANRSRRRRIVRDYIANIAADIDWQTTRAALHAIVDEVAITDCDAAVTMSGV